ncbi:Fc.00g074450.m01.CDS01 [Cosmosporella sp. VM-42]
MPVTTRRRTRLASQRDAAKPSRSSKSKPRPAKKPKVSKAKSAANERRHLEYTEAEAEHEWHNQYLQGKSSLDFPSLGCGSCPLIAPRVPFISPFTNEGSVEVMTGMTATDGPGSGSLRLSNGCGDDPLELDIFLIPFKHIEQIIIIAVDALLKTDGMYHVVVVPTAATGASAMTRKRPEIIHFRWPDRNADEGLKGEVGRKSDKKTDTYLSVLRTVLDQQLAPFDKEVIVYNETRDDLFQSPALLKLDSSSAASREAEGTLVFLSTGILWLSANILYLPFSSFNSIQLVFARDMASKTKNKKDPIVAMCMMLSVSEPFYEGDDDKPKSKLLYFKDIGEFSTLQGAIQSYCNMHGVRLDKLEQTFFNYAAGEPMTGFGPMGELDL